MEKFLSATVARWDDFLAEKNLVPRTRKLNVDYDSDSELMRNRNHGSFFSRRRREDQEATSAFRAEGICDMDNGCEKEVGDDEGGMVDSEGGSELEAGSSEDSFSSSSDDEIHDPEEVLDGFPLVFGNELAVIPSEDGASPSQQWCSSLVRSSESAGKSLRIKGRDKELRNLVFEMSFGKAKEKGFLSGNQ